MMERDLRILKQLTSCFHPVAIFASPFGCTQGHNKVSPRSEGGLLD
ncbi:MULTISPECIES: hypothetical protein [unclassified Lentimonas]|nr:MULTISPECIES: hypothetical protein [unclassified Lentimonas]CAA6691320.1 Unannotated [Lentimonas sp. CC10]CAA6695944.1 Unannotated [Lentimonas sp. CC19]CAA7068683.1 Unannotated [Lentimonas sp. CC11]